jgi:hypothetical protein
MMSAKGWIRIMVTILALSTLLLNGCGKKSEERMAEEMTKKIIKQSTGKDVDVKMKGNNIKIEGQDSKTEIAQTTTWPLEMFKDVPQFTAGKIEHVVKAKEGGMQKFNIFFIEINSDALKNYADLLKEKGWQANLIQMGDKGGMLNAQKGNLGMNFAFSAEKKDGMLAVFSTP